jgi:hypothetical protein
MEKQWPELDYTSWSPTLDTLHQWLQIVGKIRLQAMPWHNHSWHTSLYVSPSGFSTQSMPFEGGMFQIDFDFIRHELIIHSTFTKEVRMKLEERTVASFYQELFEKLGAIGLDVHIYPKPNELDHAIPFARNEQNYHYDAAAVTNFWKAMVKINNVFTRFRGQFIGKCSPVHLFWGAFDLAVTRFSGRKAPLHPGGMPNMPLEVMQEAYSQEVSSAGFWPGSKDFPTPVFYSYCYPTPKSFSQQSVVPEEAFYSEKMGEFFLPYEVVQKADHPEEVLMSFLESTYVAAAVTGKWDRASLEKDVE